MSTTSSSSSAAVGSILTATDFSLNATFGVDWALEIASAHQAHIDLVHALMLPGPQASYGAAPPDYSKALEMAALSKLEAEAARIEARGVEVTPDLRIGLPSQAVIEAAGCRPSQGHPASPLAPGGIFSR